jgi:mRNA interferase MazF
VKRGEIYIAAARDPYTGKPRPVLVIQDDSFDATASITVCPFTTNSIDAPLLRIPVEPSASNGFDRTSSLMIDKITTVPKTNLAERLGQLTGEEMFKLNRSVAVFLGIAT